MVYYATKLNFVAMKYNLKELFPFGGFKVHILSYHIFLRKHPIMILLNILVTISSKLFFPFVRGKGVTKKQQILKLNLQSSELIQLLFWQYHRKLLKFNIYNNIKIAILFYNWIQFHWSIFITNLNFSNFILSKSHEEHNFLSNKLNQKVNQEYQ